MGLQHTQRAWGLAPASRARHRRVVIPSVAPSQRGRSIVPCRLSLVVLQPWLQRALAPHWQSRAKRVVPPSMGLQRTQRAWGRVSAFRARHRRFMMPSVAPSQRARSIVPCRLSLAVLQPWLQRALALHWQSHAKRVVPPSMGLQHTQRAWGLAPASRARHRRVMISSVAPSQRARSIVSAQRSLGQRRGVERAASWPRRQPRQARSAQRQVLRGRSSGSPVTKPSRAARHETKTSQQ